MDDPFTTGACHLSDFQTDILDECLSKGGGGLSLPMGSGKTLVSLLVALQQRDTLAKPRAPVLIVAAKSLISSWITEISKFFNGSLNFEILHHEYNKKITTWKPTTPVVLTTPEFLSKHYRQYEIDNLYSYLEHINPLTVTRFYRRSTKPFLTHPIGGGHVYSIKWSVLIVDEAQCMTKADATKCLSVAALCATHRWLLSGTLFENPTPLRLLGYYLLLDHPTSPRSLPQIAEWIHDSGYPGLRSTLVLRTKNLMFTPPQINELFISHALTPEETSVYMSFKKIIKELHKELERFKQLHQVEDIRRFSSYLLAMLTYLRQCLVCALLPIASATLVIADLAVKGGLADILIRELNSLGIAGWLNNLESVNSSRVRAAIKIVERHPTDRILVFSCYQTCLKVFAHYLPRTRTRFTITGGTSLARRGEILSEFADSQAGILLLTYDLGANGLNLQCANTVVLLDQFWVAGKTLQAIARVVRFGQTADVIHVYYLTSNTGIEQAIYKKQANKQTIGAELMDGATRTKYQAIHIKDVIKMLDTDENVELLQATFKQGAGPL